MSNKYPGGIITSGANAGYSVAFDGTGDYLSISGNAAFSFAGDFTVEGWIYHTAQSTQYYGICSIGAYTNGVMVRVESSGGVWYLNPFVNSTTPTFPTAALRINLNTWYHFAVVRSGTTVTTYLNGASAATMTVSGTVNSTNGGINIGLNDLSQYWTGYVSNLRIVKGTALYTAAFTPPTQLLAVTNTSLLTCNSPAIVDQSSNNFTITANGNAAVSTFTPFQGYVAYNPALGAATPGIWTVSDAIQARQTRRWNMYDPYFNLTTLLLHGNGTNGAQNNTFLDSSTNNFTITRNGNTTQGTFTPFSQTGWSNFFDGTGDYLSGGSSADYTLGTGDFSISLWVYPTVTPGTEGGLLAVGPSEVTGTLSVWINSSRNIQVNSYFGSGVTTTSGVTINAWNYVAITRSSGTLSVYINGIRVGNGSFNAANDNLSGTALVIGRAYSNLDQSYVTGYIADFRLVKGTSLFSGASITVPTTFSTDVTNTKLLTCNSNRFVDTNTQVAAKTITPFGNTSVQAFSPFYPLVAYTPQAQGGSGYFDGTGDYLSAASNTAFAFGTGDFTWEAWVYRAASAASQELYTTMVTNGFIVYISSNKAVVRQFGVADRLTSSADVTLNTWTHIAVARSGTTLSLWLNGSRTSGGTVTNSDNFAQSGIRIGINDIGTSAFTGYISGMRVVKGTAVYDPTQTSITVPTAPPTAITNTQLLLNFTNAGIIDSTGDNVLETVGNAQISTTQSKFGGSSMYFDGTGDWAIVPANPMFNLGTSDFTIEGWFYLTTTSSAQYFLGTFSASPNRGWFAYFDTTLKLSFTYSTTGSNAVDAGFGYTPPTNTWVHIAFVRSGANLICYANGAQQGSTHNIGTSSIFANTQPLYIGERGSSPGAAFNGYIDELRITRFARYTGTFTPQTSQWQDQ